MASSTSLHSPHRSNSNGESVTNLAEPFRSMQVTDDDDPMVCLAKNLMTKMNVSCSSETEYERKLAEAVEMLVGSLKSSSISDTKHENNVIDPTSDFKDANISKSPTRSRRGRSRRRRQQSRSRTPIGVSVRKGIKSLRKTLRSRSPLPRRNDSSYENMATEADGEKFYDAASSPTPHTIATQPTKSSGTNVRPPTPMSTDNRPPLVSVNATDTRAPNENVPNMQSPGKSTFKFDKDSANLVLGSSPPSMTKIGLPARLRVVQKSKDTGFSISRVKPSPHNIMEEVIMEEDIDTEAISRRQTAPPTMASAATATGAFAKTNVDPKTPFDRPPQRTAAVPNTAPGTAEPFINKKTRNTATPPVVDTTNTMFNVDLNNNINIKTKGKGNRGGLLRRGFSANTFSANTGMNTEIKAPPTVIDSTGDQSPSNGSTMSMDTSPFFSPPLQQRQQPTSQPLYDIACQQPASQPMFTSGISFQAQFNLGVGDDANVKARAKRKENGVRRPPYQRSQSVKMPGPSRSSFDLNHTNQAFAEELSKRRLEITALREEGRSHYTNAHYQEATRSYTKAIGKYNNEMFPHVRGTHHLLVLLLSNRAAAFMMIGAYESAIGDCANGIMYAINPRDSNPDLMSLDANPALWPKLHIRMARSYIKLGKVDDADRAFVEADVSATIIQGLQSGFNITNVKEGLEQTKTDAILGRTEVSRLRTVLNKANALRDHINRKTKVERDKAMEALGHVKIALSTASGCFELHHLKVKLLADLRRWREVVSHCERFAASNVKFDGCLTGDLSSKNPFPGVAISKHLTVDFFGNTREDELMGAEMKLGRKASPEALLRLPFSMMPYYLRSLRLEERYHNSEHCITQLDRFISDRASVIGQSIYSQFSWLSEERDKLIRTQAERGHGDNFFQKAEYEKAGKKYAACLLIDSAGSNHQFTGKSNCAGGRLHAILHCNRAACFMAMKNFSAALVECTAALRIYPRYLKAILRRARCNSRLDRIREAESDFKRWLEIVQQGRKDTREVFLSACIFDGPHTVKAAEEKDVQEELDDLLKTKARAETEERARNSYRRQQQTESKKWKSESFKFTHNSGSRQSPASDAQTRREYFYNKQSSSRRWDSFREERDPKSRSDKAKSSSEKANSRKENKNNKNDYGPNNSRSSSRTRASPISPRGINNHYTALGLNRRATEDEIKKAYRKMAVKHHPDKNVGDPKAADNFRRIKDAYETLNDPKLRRKYDSEKSRGGSSYF
ncbi:hypothetical protein FRACYDRAFT_264420 [Fragilariopsis cylindrus CCMP1102]|uniref:J domain-containing protein n=1 Tax=Fragilariopsis cylindrus CCMP1102 TaxID=635003 RepID=A0A1E7ERZ9_9STRA|nr:hypothetical protein FRACYDRAFT_264420 [Fragilariopsis cylindrus CCMP1102]|eukprot:OEU08800.1 hypothetical protein FRACYDRAFT_264420 [Fragilariopsis cylindrus CCMP1102]